LEEKKRNKILAIQLSICLILSLILRSFLTRSFLVGAKCTFQDQPAVSLLQQHAVWQTNFEAKVSVYDWPYFVTNSEFI